jgi:prefoldin subunit 5
MKKFISIFTLALLLTALPFVSVKAEEPLSKEQKKAFTAQIQEKKKIIRLKTLDIQKMQSQFDDISDDMGKILESLFATDTVPNEAFVNKIQAKQEQIFNTLIEIGKIKNSIKVQKLEAKVNIDKGHYSHALLDYDKVISLLDKEKTLLKSYSETMQEFVELIKSLQYK